MIEQLQKILSSHSEEYSALLEMLSQQEKSKLEKYFDVGFDVQNNTTDAEIKFFALNALFIYIKNNPSVEEDLRDKDIPTEVLAFKIYELATILHSSKKDWETYFYVSSYAVLADKATLLIDATTMPSPDGFMQQMLKFFVDFSLPIKSSEDMDKRRANLELLKRNFEGIQQQPPTLALAQLYEIVAVSNLVSIGEKLQNYLLTGEGANIPASINNEVANAIKVFAEIGNRQWELISCLIRFVLHKHYDNAVWTVANRLPFFKKFIEDQLGRGSFLLSLFPSQKMVLQDILATHQSTVISMPTSSGKTLLAELKILYTRSLYDEECLCAYVVPTNALISQTIKRLKLSLPELKVSQLLPYNYFDSVEQQLIGNQPDIIVTTPEKLNFLIKNNDAADLINNLRLVIIDEAHNISDRARGSIWEFLLANLKQSYNQISYLLLTPFIKNRNELAEWLGNNSAVARGIEWTPTKQYVAYHSLHNSNRVSKVNYLPSARNSIIKEPIAIDLGIDLQGKTNAEIRNMALVKKYSKQSGCILILEGGRGKVEKLATHIATQCYFSQKSLENIKYAQEVIRLELGDSHPLINLLDKRVAFHHAQLSPLVKEVIEELVNDDSIKVLVATTTLAQGVNFPIKTVVFEALTVGGGGNVKELTNSDFWNIAGRAGRAYKDTEGHIVVGWQNSIKKTREKLENFIKQDIEKTISSLTVFFDTIRGDEAIDYQFIKDSPIAQNFLHYLNHLLNISFDYQLDRVSRQDIVNILSNSLYFKQKEFAEGFLETQEKIVNFSNQYLASIREKNTGQLKLADALGITDISLSTIIGRAQDITDFKLSDCIKNNNSSALAQIIQVINAVPELRISLEQGHPFNPLLIADILLHWINGQSISEISGVVDLSVDNCVKYVYSNLKNFMPWGMAIYQKISNDENPLLPSFAFYGVKDEQAVRLSYIGVPRFAIETVKNSITDKSMYDDLKQLKDFVEKTDLQFENNQSKNKIVNDIVKRSIL